MGGVKGEEKWRRDGTGAPGGGWGRGRDPTPEGVNWGTIGRSEDQKGVWPGFPCPLGPPGICGDPRPDPLPTEAPSSRAGTEGVGGGEGGAKVKARPPGPTPLRGGWGRGGVPTLSRTHARLGVQRGRGDPGGELGVRGHGRTEGNAASTFPAHLGTGETVGLQGLILCPRSLPSTESPSPAPTPRPRAPPLHLETLP